MTKRFDIMNCSLVLLPTKTKFKLVEIITFVSWYQIQEVALRVLALLACGTPDQRRRLIEVMDFITCMNETYLEGCTKRSLKDKI
jgi:hypothetical protein